MTISISLKEKIFSKIKNTIDQKKEIDSKFSIINISLYHKYFKNSVAKNHIL